MNRKQRRAEEKQGREASQGVEITLAEALRHHEAGRLSEAERLYRQILAVDPDHADSLHLLGMVAYQVGRHDVAVDLIGRAIRRHANVAFYHCNLGLALSAQGKLDAAVTSYRQALALQPDNVEACVNLGNALKDQGKLDEAIACYRRALALKPDLPEAHGNLGNALRGQGRFDEAVVCYRQAIALRPGYVEAHSNLGNVLRDQKKLAEAVACYRTALALKPDFAEGHNNLGNALKDQDKLDEAEACYRQALALKPAYPDALNNLALLLTMRGEAAAALDAIKRSLQTQDTAAARQIFVDCITKYRCTSGDSDIQAALVRALTEPWCRPSRLARTSVNYIKHDPQIGACIARAAGAWPRRLSVEELLGADGADALSTNELFGALLCTTPVSDMEMERFLTAMRHQLLDAVVAAAPEADAALRFYSALARQCFINEYVFCHDDDEIEKAGGLRERLAAALEAGMPVPARWVLAVAAYFPLFSLPAPARLLDTQWPEPVTAVLTQQICEPEQERQLSATMPRLTGIDDEVSKLVQNQYEENPYPRWVKAEPAGNARTILDYLGHHVGAPIASGRGGGETIDVLIAGCGTGQQSIGMTRLLKGARVLAVDLSVSSLSYAQRKTQELDLTSIEYAQADLLELGSFDRHFDVIASVGVLHHLADPFAGWRVLLSLLRPGGFMNLGFYSEVARRDIVKAKAFIAAQGYAATADDIRRCRQVLMDRRAQFGTTTASPDFYSTSTCRDMLFHAQEHLMTLTGIETFLRDNGLTFLGFEIDRDVVRAYRRRFPDDPAATDLAQWQIFEHENPHTFGGMYQFWIQKAD